MQTFRLIRDFREWTTGMIFTKSANGHWSLDDEFNDVSSHVCDTLLDVGGYFEDITPVVFTPQIGDTFYLITGAGEVKSKEWTNSDWCNAQKDFLGVFATREEALARLEELTVLLSMSSLNN